MRKRCNDRVTDSDGTRFRCQLAEGHPGWHLDTFRLVDAGELRLPCELRWDRRRYALEDVPGVSQTLGRTVR